MKKFTKIISMICILTFVLSFTAFAAFEDGTEVTYKLTADKASYNVGDEVTLTLSTDDMTGEETFNMVYLYTLYNADELEFVSESSSYGSAELYYDNVMKVTHEIEDKNYAANWNSLVTMTFKVLKAGDIKVDMEYEPVFCDADYNEAVGLNVPSVTINAKEAAPETPVSVSTTMTVGEKEYTNVPNATVTDVDFVGGVITGALNVDYWKDGAKVNTPVVIEASKFKGMPANVSGNGTASFTVALMGVPSNVVITGISFK